MSVDGVERDGHRHREHHGGLERAVCLYAMEAIETLRGEGHAISPGSLGENLTVAGLDWPSVVPGSRLRDGPVRPGRPTLLLDGGFIHAVRGETIGAHQALAVAHDQAQEGLSIELEVVGPRPWPKIPRRSRPRV